MEFQCKTCKRLFTAKGQKIEYHDYVFGPCMKIVAPCPDCNNICDEYRKPKPSKQAQMCSDYQPATCGNGQCCMN